MSSINTSSCSYLEPWLLFALWTFLGHLKNFSGWSGTPLLAKNWHFIVAEQCFKRRRWQRFMIRKCLQRWLGNLRNRYIVRILRLVTISNDICLVSKLFHWLRTINTVCIFQQIPSYILSRIIINGRRCTWGKNKIFLSRSKVFKTFVYIP